MSKINIRKMAEMDKACVTRMMRVFYASEAVISNGSDEIFENDVNACVSDNPYIEGYVLENDHELVGYSMVAKSFSTEFGKTCIWIEDIYIKPQFQSKGIGTQFFNFMFSTYKDVVFRLEAEDDNKKAIALYKKCGFDVLPYFEMIKKD